MCNHCSVCLKEGALVEMVPVSALRDECEACYAAWLFNIKCVPGIVKESRASDESELSAACVDGTDSLEPAPRTPFTQHALRLQVRTPLDATMRCYCALRCVRLGASPGIRRN